MATNNSGNTNPKNTTYNYTPPSGSRSSKKNDQKGDIPWWLIIVLLFSWTPAGFMLLFAKLFLMLKNGQLNSVSAKAKTASSHTGTKHAFGTNAADKTAKVKTPGKALGIFLKVFGGILIGSGIIALFTAIDSLLYWGWDSYVASEFLDAALVGLGGIVSFIAGQNNTRRANKFRKYTAVIGDRDSMLIRNIAAAIPTSYKKACKDLQRLIDQGAFGPDAYLDMYTHNFMRSASAVPEEDPIVAKRKAAGYAPQPSAAAAAGAAPAVSLSESDAVIAEIRRLNDEIDDEDVSRRIDRIEKISADIFRLVEKDPAKRSQAKSFLDYYLPTTLKLLGAYSQFEDQAASGENIRAAKENIENILDTLVKGFEQQLDRLFEADAMDISGDIRVLEQMMARDGLTEQKHTIRVPANQPAANQKAAAATAATYAAAGAAAAVQEKQE